MKKLLAVFLLLTAFHFSRAQTITDTSSLRNFINTKIVSNGSRMITAYDLNKIFNGITSLMKAYAVDSGYVSNDTLYLTRRGGFNSFQIKLPGGSGSGPELDPTVSTLVKSIDAGDTTRWGQKGVTSILKKNAASDSVFFVFNGDTSFAYLDFKFGGVLTDTSLVGLGTDGSILRVNPLWVQSLGIVGGTGAVASVFGRTGPVAAQEGDYSSFYPRLSQSYANPSWITQLAWSKITGAPTIPAQFNLIQGTGIALSGTYPNITISATGGGGGGDVSSVFGRTGPVAAQEGDYSSFYPRLSQSYANPSWITQLAWSKITGAPNFLTGVTWGDISGRPDTSAVQFGIGGGIQAFARPGKPDSLALNIKTINGQPLIGSGDIVISGGGGGGDVASVFGRTGPVTAQEGDYNSFYPRLSQSYANPSWITQLAWNKITGAPTIEPPVNADWNATSGRAQILNKPSIQDVSSGFYTPVLSNSINVYLSSSIKATYQRIGSIVHVSGKLSLQAGPGMDDGLGGWDNDITFRLSLPPEAAGVFTAADEATGTIAPSGTSFNNGRGGSIHAASASQQVLVYIKNPTPNTTGEMYFTFQYIFNDEESDPPSAYAGSDQVITLPTNSVTLNGSYGVTPPRTIDTYAWTRISGPNTPTITSPSNAFTTVTGLIQGTYVFRLTLTDDLGATGFDDVSIIVQSASNQSPTANAGADQSITLPTSQIVLSGTGTDSDGTIASYAWSRISGPNTPNIITGPSGTGNITGMIEGVYVFRLTVTDDDGATGTDDVQVTVNASSAIADTRILIDLGGNGVGDGSGFNDTGEMTPNNSARKGQDGTGKWWNNITNGFPGVILPSVVDINNVAMPGMQISIDKVPRGTFSTVDSSMNFGGYVGAVNDYPATATIDNMYFHSSAGVVTMTIPIPAGKQATIKFWGSRTSTGVWRTLEVKKSTDATYTQSFNSLNNSSYTEAATLTGVSGTAQINMQVGSGLTFGHISVIDIQLTDL